MICRYFEIEKKTVENTKNNNEVVETQDFEQIIVESKEGVRLQGFDYIKMYQPLRLGDYIDVRIRFTTGNDYLVLTRKKIENIVENNIVLMVDEDELLGMSSAKADVDKYNQTMVYAVKYLNTSDDSVRNYPLNLDVVQLYRWDPNVKNRTQDTILAYADKRTELENLLNNDIGGN